jgi:hypothetical protein
MEEILGHNPDIQVIQVIVKGFGLIVYVWGQLDQLYVKYVGLRVQDNVKLKTKQVFVFV